jgi:hypoxanthine phosphoribosyltransferase
MDFVRVKSYGSGMISSGQAVLTKDVEISVEGKPIVLVEDIVDTGLTLAHISDILREKGPESIKTCTLIDKLERRSEAVHIDYSGFRIREGFVVGYGLDYNEDYRYLPDIYVLRLPGGSS